MSFRLRPSRDVVFACAFVGAATAFATISSLARAEEPAKAAAALLDGTPDQKMRAAVLAGKPLVVHIVVPLCASSQIDCGATWAGKPGDLEKNLYWGAIFGVRPWFERARTDWERLDVGGAEGARLERRVYRRFVPGAPFGREGKIEQIAVFDAYHGDRIDEAVRAFSEVAIQGASLTFVEKGSRRTEAVLVAGYAGHNRMLDGLTLAPPPAASSRKPLPAFVLACFSERTFGPPLRAADVPLLLTTRALVAPEAYLTDAVLHALGEGKDAKGVREAAIDSYVVWQKLGRGTAGSMF